MDTTDTDRIATSTRVVLGMLLTIMAALGGAGAFGTYTNMTTKFRPGTAIGITAAGEGLAAVIALAILCFTMLRQPAPRALHLGLWMLPLAASATGVVVSDSGKEAAVFAMTPMAMSVSGEAIGWIARAVIIRTTGRDVETERRNAETARLLTYHAARSKEHPSAWVKKLSERRMWRIAKRVGRGDAALANSLTAVYRTQIAAGAESSLLSLLGGLSTAPALEVPQQREATPEIARKETRTETTFPQVTKRQTVSVSIPDPAPEDEEISVERMESSDGSEETITGTIVAEVEIPSVGDLSEAAQRQQYYAELWYQYDQDPNMIKAEFCRMHNIKGPYLSKALAKFPKGSSAA